MASRPFGLFQGLIAAVAPLFENHPCCRFLLQSPALREFDQSTITILAIIPVLFLKTLNLVTELFILLRGGVDQAPNTIPEPHSFLSCIKLQNANDNADNRALCRTVFDRSSSLLNSRHFICCTRFQGFCRSLIPLCAKLTGALKVFLSTPAFRCDKACILLNNFVRHGILLQKIE